MITNKLCSKNECGGKLDFNKNAKGRELTCKKCGAVFEYQAYMKAQSRKGTVRKKQDTVKKITIPDSIKDVIRRNFQKRQESKTPKPIPKEERKMPPKKLCKVCGKGTEAGRIWGGMHKACRKNKQPAGPRGAIQTGIPGPDGVVIPVRLEITVSLKVETN
jgi:DNA-directed RNA polymerase subunit M/transcription elongation factor TFIIS